jgi:hypothetical protein
MAKTLVPFAPKSIFVGDSTANYYGFMQLSHLLPVGFPEIRKCNVLDNWFSAKLIFTNIPRLEKCNSLICGEAVTGNFNVRSDVVGGNFSSVRNTQMLDCLSDSQVSPYVADSFITILRSLPCHFEGFFSGLRSGLGGIGGFLKFRVLLNDFSELATHHFELAVVDAQSEYADNSQYDVSADNPFFCYAKFLASSLVLFSSSLAFPSRLLGNAPCNGVGGIIGGCGGD